MPRSRTVAAYKRRGKCSQDKSKERDDEEKRQEREKVEKEMREREKMKVRDCIDGEAPEGEEDEVDRQRKQKEQARDVSSDGDDDDDDDGSTSSTGKRVTKGTNYSFCSAYEEKLVEFFERNECFYNKSLNTYSNSILKKKLLERIAKELKTTSE